MSIVEALHLKNCGKMCFDLSYLSFAGPEGQTVIDASSPNKQTTFAGLSLSVPQIEPLKIKVFKISMKCSTVSSILMVIRNITVNTVDRF